MRLPVGVLTIARRKFWLVLEVLTPLGVKTQVTRIASPALESVTALASGVKRVVIDSDAAAPAAVVNAPGVAVMVEPVPVLNHADSVSVSASESTPFSE